MPQAQVLDPVRAKIHDAIAPLLDQARHTFLPGVKLTLIVRMPGRDDMDLIISEDALDEIGKLVQRKLDKGRR